MKKRILAAVIAAVFAVLNVASALPVFALNESTMRYPTPEGYNDHDYQKLVAFLEQTDDEGVKNGEKLSNNYDPNDPATWGTYRDFQWIESDGELRIQRIDVYWCELCGTLDVSGCTALEYLECDHNNLTTLDVSGCTALTSLYCNYNNLTTLDVSGCTALEYLFCYDNNLTELDVSNNTALTRLGCGDNNLTELDVSSNTALYWLECSSNNLTALDVSNNTALEGLDCSNNNLTELDVSNNTALTYLDCYNNNLTELDLSHNPYLPLDCVKSEGNGTIGYLWYEDDIGTDMFVQAVPNNGAEFVGWYNEAGELIASAEECDFCDDSNAYEWYFLFTDETVLIAKFTEAEPIPGDADGDGELTNEDVLLLMRAVMELEELTDEMLANCDMNGDGVVNFTDALIMLRMVLNTQPNIAA
ncbi:MAG: leucine-rich repeat domain-containing protein, partial [Clostridia bacterium]|nr:leucine-rich repeat domain-containing protein [Clostridia bacterium]